MQPQRHSSQFRGGPCEYSADSTYYLIALAAILWLVDNAQACSGCGCRGGPGYRGPDGRCVGYANLKSVCGDPPETKCTREGARKVEEPKCSGCGCKGARDTAPKTGIVSAGRKLGGYAVARRRPDVRLKDRTRELNAAAKAEVKQIEVLKPKPGTK